MKFSKIAAALTLATISTGALAGGPLYIHEPTMQPYKWDTSKGSIPVWTDGGQRQQPLRLPHAHSRRLAAAAAAPHPAPDPRPDDPAE